MFFLIFYLATAIDLPQQIHIAATEVVGRLVFTWSTRNHSASEVKILYETWKTYKGEIREFKMNQNYWKVHSVVVNLIAGKVYKYQVGSFNTFSQVLKLKVPKNQEEAQVVFLGDFSFHLGGKITWKAVNEFFNDEGFESLIVTGDLAYNLHSKQGKIGDDFMNKVQVLSSVVPFMVSPGNHEGFDGYLNYFNRFDMPGSKLFYTFTVGFVRFVCIHTEVFINEGEKLQEMMGFLGKVLNRCISDYKKYPWLVVYGHRPVYCQSKNKNKSCEAKEMKEGIEDILDFHLVDLYINSHVHNYQRTLPVFKGKVAEGSFDKDFRRFDEPGKTIFVTNGAAGANKENTIVDDGPYEEWMAFMSHELSFGVLKANQSHLQYSQIRSSDGKVIDSFIIVKPYFF